MLFRSIVSYAELYNKISIAPFGLDLRDANNLPSSVSAIGPFGNRPTNHQSTFTEELQFQGNFMDGKLTWQAGAYLELAEPLSDLVSLASTSFLFCTDQDNLQCRPSGLLFGFAGNLNAFNSDAHYRDLGVYAQATYKITDKLNVTGGIRYTDDISSATSRSFTYSSGLGLGNGVFPTTGVCSLRPTAVLPDCAVYTRQHSSAPTWVINLDYKPVDDVMIYAKYSRGYRQGLVNYRAYTPNDKFDQEKVDTYEIGAKTSWRGAVSGFLNLAGFYSDFTNQQYNITFQSTGAGGFPANLIQPITCACAKSRIYGAEVDASIAYEGLRLSGGYAYLNTKITDFREPPYPNNTAPNSAFVILDSTAANTIGRPLIQTPRHKANATLAYTLPLPESIGQITPSATFVYSASFFARSQPTTLVAPYSILNLNLAWNNVAGAPIDISAFATNVGNRHYYVAINDVGAHRNAILGMPRMWGVRLKYRFGGDAN